MYMVTSVTAFRRALRLGSQWVVTRPLTGNQWIKEVTHVGEGWITLMDYNLRYNTRFFYPVKEQCCFDGPIKIYNDEGTDYVTYKRIK
jgi:hypothetical protein